MVKTVDAFFDGEVLHPAEPLELAPNTRVRITVEAAEAADREPMSFLDVARSLNLDGPPDWSENLHEYLYGMLGR